MHWTISYDGSWQLQDVGFHAAAHFIFEHMAVRRTITAFNSATGETVEFIGKPKGVRLITVARKLRIYEVEEIQDETWREK